MRVSLDAFILPPFRKDGATLSQDKRRTERTYLRYMGLGLQYGVALTLFALGGVWLDDRYGTSPIFVIVGFLLGFVGATTSLIFQVQKK